jgi:hypothetical protein
MAQEDDFTSAFNGDEPAAETQTEDQVFGLEDDVTEESQAMPEDQGEAETGSEGSAGDDAEGGAPSVVIAADPAAEEDMPTDPKEQQLEHRLRARGEALSKIDREINAKKAELERLSKQTNEPMEPGETQAQEAAEPGVTEAVEDAVEAVQSGDMSIEQALSGLTDTFGDEFTKMLGVLIEKKASEIAGRTADDRFGKVKGEIDGLANEIVADKASSHMESIADAHPDFMDVAGSPEFKAYIDGMDDMQKPKAMQVIENGSARQIVKLLDTYKSTQKKVDPPQEDPAMDAAEGVRSKGMKIPEKPAVSDDFAEAFNQF